MGGKIIPPPTQIRVKFWFSESNTENTMSGADLYFNEESDYSVENTWDNEDFRSTILQPFQLEPEQKKACGNEGHEKETKHIHTSAVDLLHIRIGNLDWCKWGHCKNEGREIDNLYCREVDAMLIASTKILKRREASRHPAFMGIHPTISHTCLPYLPSILVLLLLPQGFGSFHSHLPRARWCNLVCVECL